MKFTDILILSVILVGGYSYFFNKDEPPTVNEKLIAQFEKYKTVRKGDWEKGEVIDSVQVYTAKTDYPAFQSVWLLGVNEASVMVVTSGKYPKIEPSMALGQCKNLAESVMDNRADSIGNAVSTIFTTAVNTFNEEGKKVKASAEIGNTPFSVTVQNIDSALTYSCVIGIS
ncbi:hypothetical protein GTGU_04648 [Trabulsiella guamensis ATCC 49490]|uniref:Uncharacterized protein n=1 Tax=Trabulsiella guamensis ATCC 49490 TaxID=1005994 RepID=A0A084ZII7_9ENTR|nr:hypothetical protein [Trabulsiella guamensis]KFB97281.1 hypothetical protein GTGU_04648 [Trabulsiella guamensis ATCC 49490]